MQSANSNSNNMQLLLTGGAGFLGSRFIELYHNSFKDIYVFDNFSAVPRILNYPNVHYIRGDICDLQSYSQLPETIDLCIHLAAAISVAESVTNPAKYKKINVDGSKNVFEWCSTHGCKVCVCASTAAVYGKVKEGKYCEEDADGGLSPYAQTKFEMEKIARQLFPTCQGVETYGESRISSSNDKYLNEDNEMRINFIRPFNIYGPNQPCGAHPSFIPAVMQRALNNGSVTVCGDGLQSRDFVFVDDVCKAFYALATYSGIEEDSSTSNSSSSSSIHPSNLKFPKHLKPYNVGTGNSIKIITLAERIVDIVNKQYNKDVHIEHTPARPQEAMFSEADVSSIKNEVGWQPTISLDKGLELTCKWFAEKNNTI